MPSTGSVTDSVADSGNVLPRVGWSGFARRIEVGLKAGFLDDSNRAFDRRRILVDFDPGRSYANLFCVQAVGRKSLANAAHAGPAMHSINPQCEIRHHSTYMH